MAADATICESYLGTGTKEKVEMSQSGRLQRSSCFLCGHYLPSFRLQDALYLHLKEKKKKKDRKKKIYVHICLPISI